MKIIPSPQELLEAVMVRPPTQNQEPQHSPEPWTYEPRGEYNHACIKDGNGRLLCHEKGLALLSNELPRVAACVTALAGIEDPQAFVASVRKLLEDCHDGFDWLQDGHDCCTAFPLKQRISAMLAQLDGARAGRGSE